MRRPRIHRSDQTVGIFQHLGVPLETTPKVSQNCFNSKADARVVLNTFFISSLIPLSVLSSPQTVCKVCLTTTRAIPKTARSRWQGIGHLMCPFAVLGGTVRECYVTIVFRFQLFRFRLFHENSTFSEPTFCCADSSEAAGALFASDRHSSVLVLL